MLEIILQLVALIVPSLIGLTILDIMKISRNAGYMHLLIAPLFGYGILSILMFSVVASGFKITLVPVWLVFIFSLSYQIWYYKKRKLYSLNKNNKIIFDLSVCLVAVVFFVLPIVYQAFFQPVVDWDSLVLYDFRAKVLVDTGLFDKAIEYGYFDGYPMHTTMVHAWYYLLGLKTPMMFYAINYFSLGFIFFAEMRREAGIIVSSFFAALVMTFPVLHTHSLWAYTNLPFTVNFFIAFLLLNRWIMNPNFGYALTSSFLQDYLIGQEVQSHFGWVLLP